MKTNVLSLLAFIGALLLTTSCASEDATKEQKHKEETKGLTEFVVTDNTTRTTAEYDGSCINFYWTEGDRLWVNNGTLIQDKENTISDELTNNPTISTGVKRAAKASFSFEGSYTASSYPVRYTGKGNTAGDKVTIKAQQNQNAPNDASHIGESGDCGTAVAQKSGIRYNFTLDHKASYLTLLPYSTINFATTVKLTRIKITANEAISGQFNFDDNGIDLTSRPAPTTTNRSITLTLNGGGTNGFTLPVAATKETNASIIVLPPGTYNNVSIEYSLYDQNTGKAATFKKEYATLTFSPGKNKKISTNLKQIPIFTIEMGGYYQGCGPNTNEALWYMLRGNPHMDISTIYAARRHASYPANICQGGIWMKRHNFISGFRGDKAPDGHNYVSVITGSGYVYSEFVGWSVVVPYGNPQDGTYHFLPSVYPDGTTALKSWDGTIRYWMGIGYNWGTQGVVFSADRAPHKIEIGNGPVGVVMGYWPAFR